MGGKGGITLGERGQNSGLDTNPLSVLYLAQVEPCRNLQKPPETVRYPTTDRCNCYCPLIVTL